MYSSIYQIHCACINQAEVLTCFRPPLSSIVCQQGEKASAHRTCPFVFITRVPCGSNTRRCKFPVLPWLRYAWLWNLESYGITSSVNFTQEWHKWNSKCLKELTLIRRAISGGWTGLRKLEWNALCQHMYIYNSIPLYGLTQDKSCYMSCCEDIKWQCFSN